MNPINEGLTLSRWGTYPEHAHPTKRGYLTWATLLRQQLIADGVVSRLGMNLVEGA